MMKHTILNKLKTLEETDRIKILYACESGSRAWGFESPDSDYDVRFIYVKHLDFYLSIEQQRDTIEIREGELDFVGWDLKKALFLLRKSNPSLTEWLNSPIVYLKENIFFDSAIKLLKRSFNPKASMHHYLSLAKSNYREYLRGKQVRLKKYFYVIRPILALKWIEANNRIPPIEIDRLLQEVSLSEEIRNSIYGLLKEKKKTKEMGYGRKIPKLNEFIEKSINYYEDLLKTMAHKHTPPDMEEFNSLFRLLVKKFSH